MYFLDLRISNISIFFILLYSTALVAHNFLFLLAVWFYWMMLLTTFSKLKYTLRRMLKLILKFLDISWIWSGSFKHPMIQGLDFEVGSRLPSDFGSSFASGLSPCAWAWFDFFFWIFLNLESLLLPVLLSWSGAGDLTMPQTPLLSYHSTKLGYQSL